MFWVTNKGHYGMLWYFWSGQLISFLENDTQVPDLHALSQGKLLENYTLHSGHIPV